MNLGGINLPKVDKIDQNNNLKKNPDIQVLNT